MAMDQLGIGYGDGAMDRSFDRFTAYVSEGGSYDRTYGSLGAVMILLLLLSLTVHHPRRAYLMRR